MNSSAKENSCNGRTHRPGFKSDRKTSADAMNSSAKENSCNGRTHRHGFQRDKKTSAAAMDSSAKENSCNGRTHRHGFKRDKKTSADAMDSSAKGNSYNSRTHSHGFKRDQEATAPKRFDYFNGTYGEKCQRPHFGKRRSPSMVMKSVDLNNPRSVHSRSPVPQGTPYAGPKCDKAPSPSKLPKPPSHWLVSENTVSNCGNLSSHLKTLLNIPVQDSV
ncbi:hypothetical protein CHS0354_006108 [Potamilus streckersoni]|uniref:Proline-rich nuclear receptor coactivator 2 n=1 Tax=Potamilus streckersoni TaxID=2493646 RepID=A0AAE0W279_9BIVA|nr:hypothetical protein CHS0354_006108 [Potamilus streckersoni]